MVSLPGSKSLTNRFLVLASLADDTTRVRRPLRSRDTLLMVDALRALGAVIEDVTAPSSGVAEPAMARPGTTGGTHDADWLVRPASLASGADIHAGLAGTVMRFVPPVAALSRGEVRFDGDPQARRRPMGQMLTALAALGVDVDDGGHGGLPFTVRGTGAVPGGAVTLDASASSQFISGLLLSAARYERGVTVHHDGKPVPSEPHLRMTVEVLRDAGVEVDDSRLNTWRVHPGPISGSDVEVEPDLSNAAAFLAAAVVTGGSVRVPGWPQNTTQAGDAIRDIFDAMGADVTLDRSGLTVTGSGAVNGLDVDLHDAGELTPVVAAVAAVADSPTWIRGVAHLRGHETDRLAALSAELNALGGSVEETEDGLRIRPAQLRGGVFGTYDDHRMAMAAAVVGLTVPGVVVQNVATVGKTLPDFTSRWAAMVQGAAGA